MSKIFLDTNILVYSMDIHRPKKRNVCRELLKTVCDAGTGVLSTQVLQEFYVVATKKLGVEPLLAKSLLHSFENLEVVVITPELISEAIDCSIINRISFWDALIISAAESARCEQVWTEDLNDGSVIRGVHVVNPITSS